jgi:hypothetical protein
MTPSRFPERVLSWFFHLRHKMLGFWLEQTTTVFSYISPVSLFFFIFACHFWKCVTSPDDKVHTSDVTLAPPSKEWACFRWLTGISGLNPRWGHGRLSPASIVYFQLEATALGWSLVQRSLTECRMSECDHETSTSRRSWSTRGCCALGG